MPKRNPMSGLRLRNGVWHIDKRYKHAPGGRLRASTGFNESQLDEAEALLIRELDRCRKVAEFGERPHRTLEEAAVKYLQWNKDKSSLRDDVRQLKYALELLGRAHPLHQINLDTLQPVITARQQAGVKTRTINSLLEVIRHMLNQAAHEWMENGLTWLERAPRIKLLKIKDASTPYPLSWDEQDALFKELHRDLADAAMFKVNTGNREQEVVNLRWEWEHKVPDLPGVTVFIIPPFIDKNGKPMQLVKNGEPRLVVLNEVAQAVINARRGIHDTYVFTYKGKPFTRMYNSAWKMAWKAAGLPGADSNYKRGVHNLKHTFGRRLRAAGVPFETRQVLLGHKGGEHVTTHYSGPEIIELIEAANLVCKRSVHKSPTLALVKKQAAAHG